MKSIKISLLFVTAIWALTGCSNSFKPEVMITTKEESQEESRQPIVMETDKEVTAPLTESSSQAEEEEKEVLTMEKVLELSDKEDLGWADFENYASQDVGSGLMILEYAINERFILVIGGPGNDEKPMYIRLASLDGEDYIELPTDTDDAEEFISRHTSPVNYVGIKGHIKEVHEGKVLISSDTEDYPGIFWVLGAEALAAPEELKGGTDVFVLMRDTGETGEDGISRYRAKKFYAFGENESGAVHDILLTDVPPFALTDVLSSTYGSFEIQPGNYSWDSGEDGEGKGIIACGAAPLEEAALPNAARLKLPRYNKMDYVGYSFSTEIMPDQLTVRQWAAEDIGKDDAKEESVSTYYYVTPFLELEPGKVYEFAAEWKKENKEQHGFSGTASYVLVTE